MDWVEASHISKARHWSRHRGDRGERAWGGYPGGVWGAPSPGKVS